MRDAMPLPDSDRAILALEGPTLVGHTCKVVRLGPGAPTVTELRAALGRRLGDAPLLTRRLGGPLCRRVGELRLVGLGLLAATVGVALSAGHGLPVVAPGVAAFGLALPWVIIGFNTALQRGTPARLQGRAYSAADMAMSVPQTLSIAGGAVLVAVLDYRWLLAAMALVYAGSAFALLRPAPPIPAGVEPATAAVSPAGLAGPAGNEPALRAG